jgi:membrane-bound lytic murein transglycosylase D
LTRTPIRAPSIPFLELWLRRVRDRPLPANAGRLMPRLRADFAAEGVTPDLAWLAEAESSLNPRASNPSGARGLFQLKAATARDLGLSTFLPDQRTDPDQSAHAAARYLRSLERRFGSWPLAIAAYNAGEGRVARALSVRQASNFAEIASALPAGTQMYVPEVCALIETRTGTPPARLPLPRG